MASNIDDKRPGRRHIHATGSAPAVATVQPLHAVARDDAQRWRHLYETSVAVNRALVRAKSPESLYQDICDVIVGNGLVVAAAVVSPQGTKTGSVVAVAG